MGFMSEHMFANDRDMDILGGLADEFGVETLTASALEPGAATSIRQALDGGKFQAKFDALRAKGSGKSSAYGFSARTEAVVLGAAAIELGVAITPDHHAYLQECLQHRLGMYTEAKLDMAKALHDYQDGQPIELAEYAKERYPRDAAGKQPPYCVGGRILNYHDPQMYGGIEEVPSACYHCNKEKADMRVCGRCRHSQYCGVACQKAAWKNHKKTCREGMYCDTAKIWAGTTAARGFMDEMGAKMRAMMRS